jgi:hypothetical protein
VSGSPRFSVVVPTRDRPDLLDFCLESLAGQTYDDFEVVVTDNHTTKPAREVFDRWAREGWRYVTPPSPIPMHDNFELACDEARGEHVAVMIDKTVLQPSALGVAAAAIDAAPDGPTTDIVTWWSEGFDAIDEARALAPGRYRPSYDAAAPATYDARAELDARFAMAAPRGTDGIHYFRGKIVFGAFSRHLLDRIKATTGRVFHPLAPDYTSMVPALVYARSSLDVGRPLLVSYNSVRSNGRLQALDPTHARRFIEQTDASIIDRLPIPGLYGAVHNVVAFDYVTAAARCPAGTVPDLNVANLLRRARDDLAAMQWTDARERDAQYAILDAAELAHGVEVDIEEPAASEPPPTVRGRVAALLAHAGPLERVAYRLSGRPSLEAYESPVAAARAADAYYARP